MEFMNYNFSYIKHNIDINGVHELQFQLHIDIILILMEFMNYNFSYIQTYRHTIDINGVHEL
jgi:hypothetical protein